MATAKVLLYITMSLDGYIVYKTMTYLGSRP